MGDGVSVVKHLNVFNTIMMKLILVGVNMDEEDNNKTSLCSLLNSYDKLVMAIKIIG